MYSDIPTYVGQPFPYDTTLPLPILGWSEPDEFGFAWPILPEATPEYKARLAEMDKRYRESTQYKRTSQTTAEDLDRKCNEVHEANEQMRTYGRY